MSSCIPLFSKEESDEGEGDAEGHEGHDEEAHIEAPGKAGRRAAAAKPVPDQAVGASGALGRPRLAMKKKAVDEAPGKEAPLETHLGVLGEHLGGLERALESLLPSLGASWSHLGPSWLYILSTYYMSHIMY